LVSNQIKNIKHNNKKIYKKHFAPVFDYCIIEFNKLSKLDINKCENFLDNINYPFYNEYSNFIKSKFYIFYIRYIYGAKTIHKYLNILSGHNVLFNNYISSFHYLLITIMLMQKNKIVHNDLFDRNIIFDKKLNVPIVIDFGLSYQVSRLYNIDGTKLIIKMLHKFLFDFRSDSYQYNIDKRFITFFSHNKNDYYNIKVTKLNQKNDLNQQLLDIFIDDAYNSILGSSSLVNIFEKQELQTYRLLLQDFYGKFLNKKMYFTSYSIIKELLPSLIKFSDIYSLSIEYIKIYITLLESHDKNSIFKNLFLQLFKKTLFPNPEYRLDSKQLRNIVEFFINNLNSFNLNSFDSEYNKFISDFDKFLMTHDIKKENFFFSDFAYIDFEKILIPENIKIFQSYKLTYYKCQYI
jgi:hypothetical protein